MWAGGVMWRADGGAVVLFLNRPDSPQGRFPQFSEGPEGPEFCYCVPATGEVSRHVVKRPEGSGRRCEVTLLGWAGGGRGILILGRDPNGRSVLELLDPKTGQSAPLPPPAAGLRGLSDAASLRPLDLPGWLVAGRDGAATYALNETLTRSVLLTRSNQWTLSPDGRRIAEVDALGGVAVREVNLPAAP